MTETSRGFTEFEHSTSQRCLAARSAKAMVLITLLCPVRCALAQTGPGALLFPLDPYAPLVKQVGLSKELWALPRAVHLKSQTGVTPAQSAIAKPTAAAPVDQRQSLYVERLKRGDDSPEVFAYLKGLRKEEITALLETSSRYNKEDQRLREKLVATLIDRHGVSDQNLEGLSDAIVLAVGDYYRDQPDQRCVKVYEGLLAKRKTKSDGYIPELEALAQYYQKIGDAAKAAETFLRGEQYTTDKPLLANFTVEAAREYMQLGDEKRANELYEGVEKHGYGWATGMAIYDRAQRFISVGKHEEARRLLTTSVSGLYSEEIKVVLLSTLARSYYLTGDFEAARGYSQATIRAYDSLSTALSGEGIDEKAEKARILLRLIEQWKERPIVSDPMEIRATLSREDMVRRRLRWRLYVASFGQIPLSVNTTDENLKVSIEPAAFDQHTDETQVEREVIVEIKPGTLKKSLEATVTFQSSRFPGYELRVPIHIEKP